MAHGMDKTEPAHAQFFSVQINAYWNQIAIIFVK